MKTKIISSASFPTEAKAPFLSRFYQYQKERFPILGHGVLVAAFTFSAISYSRICRGAQGFVEWQTFLVGIFTTVSLFLLVRIFDEFKDAEDDAKYRKELPVPRGLVSLKELFVIGLVVAILQVVINLWFFPKMLLIYGVVITWLCLMGVEFFIPNWLKRHQFWYVVSHMLIIPLVDVYASGLDWLLGNATAPKGLIFFFAVSFMNGIVLEIGRKIRTLENEKEGVLTYSSMLGANRATLLWILVLFVTLCLSIAAAQFAGYGMMALIILSSCFLICALPAFLFLRKKDERFSKLIEKLSALWTIIMYLSLGGIPMLQALLFNH